MVVERWVGRIVGRWVGWSLDGYQVLELVEAGGADAVDFAELVDGGEVAVLGAPVEDSLGGDGSDAGQGVQLGQCGGVEVDLARRRGGVGGGRRDADGELFAVGEAAGEVEGAEV